MSHLTTVDIKELTQLKGLANINDLHKKSKHIPCCIPYITVCILIKLCHQSVHLHLSVLNMYVCVMLTTATWNRTWMPATSDPIHIFELAMCMRCKATLLCLLALDFCLLIIKHSFFRNTHLGSSLHCIPYYKCESLLF